jgi:hypothetical protein
MVQLTLYNAICPSMPYSISEIRADAGLRFTFEYLMLVTAADSWITYGEIADRLQTDMAIDGKVFPTHIGGVVGTLMERILEVDHSAPLINLLVINQRTRQPSSGADEFLWHRFHLPRRLIPRDRRRRLVEKEAISAYGFDGWPRIYRRLFGIPPPEIDPASLVTGTEGDPPRGGFGGPAESREHRRLKEYIYGHPALVGAPARPKRAKMEFALLSQDEVNVFFEHRDTAHLIEVKSIRSSEPDLKRGVYQCVKYRAVFQAQRIDTTPDISIQVTLVTEIQPSSDIQALAKRNRVRIRVVPVNRRL